MNLEYIAIRSVKDWNRPSTYYCTSYLLVSEQDKETKHSQPTYLYIYTEIQQRKAPVKREDQEVILPGIDALLREVIS